MDLNTKTKELLTILENIENSYNPGSTHYKFTHVFYSMVDTPIERPLNFPQDLWNRYFIPNSPLMPVILNKQQIEERKQIQNELARKLGESKNGVLKKLESLKFKREAVRNRLENVVVQFRRKMRRYVHCREEDGSQYALQTDIVEREKLAVRERKEEVLKYLAKMKTRLEQFDKRVSEAMHVYEKGIAFARQLDKKY